MLIPLLIVAALGGTAGLRAAPPPGIGGRLPLAFEANAGLAGDQAGFVARGRGFTLMLKPTEATLRPRRGPELSLKLAGGNLNAPAQALGRLRGKVNYLSGNDPRRWRVGVPTFGRVRYTNVYPGIDLIYYGREGKLEYDFVVAPGADPARIRLRIEGARRIAIGPEGGLVVDTAAGRMLQHRPAVYQTVRGVRRELSGRYVLERDQEVAFAVEQFDRRAPLVIDPVIVFSSYFGDINDDRGTGIAVDKDGYAYVTGWTESPEDKRKKAYVLKLTPAGDELVYATLLGGSEDDYAHGIALDPDGNPCIVGQTWSKDFPIANGFLPETSHISSGFVAKLNREGDGITYSSYLDSETTTAVAVDAKGLIYATGSAHDIPITGNALRKAFGGGDDAFVMKINPAAEGVDSLLYSTYLGGSLADSGESIAVDKDGNIYVAGKTISPDFPVANAFQGRYHDGPDAFVAKIDPDGANLIYSTYLGTDQWDEANGIAVDASGNAYVIGRTNSKVFPVTAEAYQKENGGGFCDVNISALRDCFDAFVAKLDAAGALVYATLLGGPLDQEGRAIAVDKAGNAYVTGKIWGPDLRPISKLNATGSALVFSVFDTNARGNAIALDKDGNIWVTGETRESIPLEKPLQEQFGGGFNDAFVVKIEQTPEERQ